MHANYTDAPATALLDVRCCCCGRELLDAKSVELGIGPVCREKTGFDSDLPEAARRAANALVAEAALVDTTAGRCIEIAEEVKHLGLAKLATRIRERFGKKARREARREGGHEAAGPVVLIGERVACFGRSLNGHDTGEDAEALSVSTPYNRDFVGELKAAVAWQDRIWEKDEKVWVVRTSCRPALWALLKKFFGGSDAVGPKGAFAIPVA